METSQHLFRSGKAAKNSFRKHHLRHVRKRIAAVAALNTTNS